MKQYPSAPNQLISPAIEYDGDVFSAIQPNGKYNLLYDPYGIQQRCRRANEYAAEVSMQNEKADRLGEITDEEFRTIAQASLADRQADTMSALEQVAVTIPYEVIGKDLINFDMLRTEQSQRLKQYEAQRLQDREAVIAAVKQVEELLDAEDDMANALARQRLGHIDAMYDLEAEPLRKELQQTAETYNAVISLYRTIRGAWEMPRIRRPTMMPKIHVTEETSGRSLIQTTPGSIGERIAEFSAIQEDLPITVLPSGDVTAEWRMPDIQVAILEQDAEPPYDPDYDSALHQLNGTRPPKTAADKVKDLADLLRASAPDEAYPIVETDLTQHQRIAAFLIAHAGETVSALDIGTFLYRKEGELTDATFVTNKARTLLGPKIHGKKVLEAMLPHNFCIQRGTKSVNAGKARTIRVYRGLSLGLTVLPEDPDPAVTWDPLATD